MGPVSRSLDGQGALDERRVCNATRASFYAPDFDRDGSVESAAARGADRSASGT